jgi:hypothetical protein
MSAIPLALGPTILLQAPPQRVARPLASRPAKRLALSFGITVSCFSVRASGKRSRALRTIDVRVRFSAVSPGQDRTSRCCKVTLARLKM